MASNWTFNVRNCALRLSFDVRTRDHESHDKENAKSILASLQAAYPERNGYKITITRWECIGYEVTEVE